jgi:hypothetical protein
MQTKILSVVLLFLTIVTAPTFAEKKIENIKDQQEWQVEPGYVFKEDSGEFLSAVGMAFFEKAGDRPADPKAIVTELRGKIHLVTNDGTTLEIQTDEEIMQPEKELPDFDGENGQIGACLSPDEKYVFTTGVFMDGWKKLNKITKWRPAVGSNWRKIEKVTDLKKIFNDDTAGKAHQIGHCFVDGNNHLWVGVGDGHNPQSTHLPSHSNGKVLRMNLDLKAVPENPFYKSTEPEAIAGYVYAMGFRNPFAIKKLEGRLYVADNGPAVDRFVYAKPGQNFPWDNTDDSFTYGNLMTFPRPVGPADMVYVPHGHALKDLWGHIVIAAAHKASIVAFPFEPKSGTVQGKMKWIVRPSDFDKRGHHRRRGDFAGLALADEGLYVSYIRTNPKGGLIPATLLKLVPAQAQQGPLSYTGEQLVHVVGCRNCHSVAGLGGERGPALDGLVTALNTRLEDKSYLSKLQKLQAKLKDEEDDKRWSKVRAALIAQDGSMSKRVRLWIETKIQNPYFDDPSSNMPQFNLTEDRAQKLADFIIKISDPSRQLTGLAKYEHLLMTNLAQDPGFPLTVVLVLGILLGVGFRNFFSLLFRKVKGLFFKA